MRKLFFPAIISSAFFLFSCGNSADTQKSNDTVGGNQKGMTVTDPKEKENELQPLKDSIFNGEHIERYPNGVIYMKGPVSGGLRHGEWITFYRSGKEWSRGTYIAGFSEGYCVSYWENGQKSSEGNYKHGKKVGKWKWWGEQGKMVEKDMGGE